MTCICQHLAAKKYATDATLHQDVPHAFHDYNWE